jgi:glycosyltransferase involved in cell wall biosynthesis
MTVPKRPLTWCVVLPAFREAARIAPVVAAACAQGATVLVVDDGSPDETAAVAEAAGAVVLRHPVNRGKGAALETGFAEASRRGCDVVITMDADGQHDPAELRNFIEAYQRTGIPVLIGSRMAEMDTMPWVRRATNRFMSWLLSRMMGQYVPDTQCGYRLYRSDVLPLVVAGAQGFAAESEVLLRLAARGVRMDSVRIRTIYGTEISKIHPVRDTLRFIGMLRRYRREQQARSPSARVAAASEADDSSPVKS